MDKHVELEIELEIEDMKPTMNEHVELVKTWLDDPDSVTQEQLEENSSAAANAAANAAYAAYAARADDAAAYAAAYAANAAANAAYAAADAAADESAVFADDDAAYAAAEAAAAFADDANAFKSAQMDIGRLQERIQELEAEVSQLNHELDEVANSYRVVGEWGPTDTKIWISLLCESDFAKLSENDDTVPKKIDISYERGAVRINGEPVSLNL